MKEFEDENSFDKILITDNHGFEEGETYNNQSFNERRQEVINGCINCFTDSYITEV
jgi:hypothetical protein